MENAYLKELILKLEQTQIWHGTGESAGCCKTYDDGIRLLVDLFTEHKRRQSQVFFFGNGGSAAIASHMAADFMKNGGMNTMSLYDSAVMTCMGNDYGYEYVFSRPMQFLAKKGDLAVAISSSGNSPNIINAILAAKEKGAKVITFTGFLETNKARQLGSINVYVPCEKYGMVESIHNLILQQAVDLILERDGVRF